MATNPYPLADTNLFTSAYASGVTIGRNTPSDFAAFTGAFISGLDDEQKAEALRQQNEIHQNEIDQIPVTNRINEARATQAEAQVAAYNQDPATFTALQVAKAKNDLEAERQQADLMQRRTQFVDIIKGPDGVAKGVAYTSGQFDDVLAADPKLAEQAQNTITQWGSNSQDAFFFAKDRERNAAVQAQLQATMAKKFETDQAAYTSNHTIAQWAETAETSPWNLVDKGEIKMEAVPQKVLQLKPDGTPETDAEGNSVFTTKMTKDPLTGASVASYKNVPTLYFAGKRIGDETDDKDAIKAFNNYKHSYKYVNQLFPDQYGGTGWLKAQVDQSKQAESARQAAADATTKATDTVVQDNVSKYMSGIHVKSEYQPAFDALTQRRQQNLSEQGAPAPQPTQSAQAQPPLQGPKTQAEAKNNLPVEPTFTAVPTKAGTMSDDAFLNKSMEYAQEGSIPAASSQNVPRGMTFQGIQMQEEPWAAKMRQQRELASSKATAILQKIQAGKQQTAPAQAPAPVSQSAQVTSSTEVPDKIYTKGQPNIAAVRTVASMSGMQGFSAITKAVMAQESAGNIDARSSTGVRGLMQVTQSTGEGIIPGYNAKDPMQSLLSGAIELEKLSVDPLFNNNPMLVLTAYNTGAGVVSEAVSLAGGATDWNTVKKYIPQAVMSPRFASYWAKINVDPIKKAAEASAYAERVLPYFAAFARTKDDMAVAKTLQSQGLIKY